MADLLGNSYINDYVPRVIEEDASGKHSIDLMTKHMGSRKIFLMGIVDDAMANDFVVKALHFACEKLPIDIYINSCGGSVQAGLTIYDVMQELKDRGIVINCYCTGMAASMGAVLLSAGSKNHRYMLPHAKAMIHEPLIDGRIGGSASTIRETAESILKTKALLNSLLAKHTGKTVKQIDKATERDTWFEAEETIHFGLADKVCGLLSEEVA